MTHRQKSPETATSGPLSVSRDDNSTQAARAPERAADGRTAPRSADPHPTRCDTCRTHQERDRQLTAEWHAATRPERPSITDQLIRNLEAHRRHTKDRLSAGASTPLARHRAAIADVMLLGLEGADLTGTAGIRRIHEWADWLAEQAATVTASETAQLRAERELLARTLAVHTRQTADEVLAETRAALDPHA